MDCESRSGIDTYPTGLGEEMMNIIKNGTVITQVVVPIDPKTGKPRNGRWVNRQWAPKPHEPRMLLAQSNPNFVLGDGTYFNKGKE